MNLIRVHLRRVYRITLKLACTIFFALQSKKPAYPSSFRHSIGKSLDNKAKSVTRLFGDNCSAAVSISKPVTEAEAAAHGVFSLSIHSNGYVQNDDVASESSKFLMPKRHIPPVRSIYSYHSWCICLTLQLSYHCRRDLGKLFWVSLLQ